jgi:DNA (cytosine-5)-methyltransferase 1
MKILNLYAGIGGNRKLWGDDHEITAVEHDERIAAIYHGIFPDDKIVVGDAHDFLLKHYQEYDFIWSSPPCPSHSRTNAFLNSQGIIRYPDMKLWQEIVFLQSWFKGKWLVENVISYYPPLYPPTKFLDRHYFWGNFIIKDFAVERTFNIANARASTRKPTKDEVNDLEKYHGFDLGKVDKKRLMLRNCVYPPLGKHILDCAMRQFHYPAMPLFT